MGKGDKRTKRGKIHIGSTGVVRPKKKKSVKKAVNTTETKTTATKTTATKKAATKKAAKKAE
jgi:30S ribosomal protein S31